MPKGKADLTTRLMDDNIFTTPEQTSTNVGMVATDIDEITKIITQVNDTVGTNASAVEEQSATNNEIAGDLAQASLKISKFLIIFIDRSFFSFIIFKYISKKKIPTSQV